MTWNMASAQNNYVLSRGFCCKRKVGFTRYAFSDFGQCPPKAWLPRNISWITHDIFADLPIELLEKYDVIHVQLSIIILRDGSPDVAKLNENVEYVIVPFLTALHSLIFLMN